MCPKDVKCGVDNEVVHCPSCGKSEKFENNIRKRIYIKVKLERVDCETFKTTSIKKPMQVDCKTIRINVSM